jgi:hypothetical protein
MLRAFHDQGPPCIGFRLRWCGFTVLLLSPCGAGDSVWSKFSADPRNKGTNTGFQDCGGQNCLERNAPSCFRGINLPFASSWSVRFCTSRETMPHMVVQPPCGELASRRTLHAAKKLAHRRERLRHFATQAEESPARLFWAKARDAEEVEDLLPGRWYTHRLSRGRGKDLPAQQVRRAQRSQIPNAPERPGATVLQAVGNPQVPP